MSRDADIIAQARAALAEGAFDAAVAKLQSVSEDHHWSPTDLLLKARSIQLSSGTGPFTLEDAEAALRQALDRDPENPVLLVELGLFVSRVLDQAEEAKPLLQEGLRQSVETLEDAVAGLEEVAGELEGDATAAAYRRPTAGWVAERIQTPDGAPSAALSGRETEDGAPRRWRLVWKVVSLLGCGLVVLGLVIVRWASPSPHGFIEFFFGFPVATLGVLLAGAGLTQARQTILRATGWSLLAAMLVLITAVLFVRPR